ncbi:chitin synthase [Hamiltosporidium magnivora]|uniref:chitin synthase n=2 Tax=Hamiltosporidium TaxID=1176354 RepID=A0A4Q9LEW1_9MICR|nr:chitin synthase [Hamiltosporidium magnivora]
MSTPSQGEILRSVSRTFIKKDTKSQNNKKLTPWRIITYITTFFIPNCILRLFNMSNPAVQQAWREKVTLCFLIFLGCMLLGFITYLMNILICKNNNQYIYSNLENAKLDREVVFINGVLSYIDNNSVDVIPRTNITPFIKQNISKSCRNNVINLKNAILKKDNFSEIGPIHYTYKDVNSLGYIIIDDKVYDPGYCIDSTFNEFIEKYKGKSIMSDGIQGIDSEDLVCFKDTFYAGKVSSKTVGCIVSDIMLYISTVAIFGLIITRFVLATVYSWHIKRKARRHRVGECYCDTVSVSGNNRKITFPNPTSNPEANPNLTLDGRINGSITGQHGNRTPLPCILLVTCYSEGREGLKSTLDSLCMQMYPYEYKLIVVIADGMIKGSENDKTTPEILLELIEVDNKYPIIPQDYIALADGNKRHNRAKVYPGKYKINNNVTNILLIVKCGNCSEDSGNRGKRDSQVILMSFYQKLLYNDRLSSLDFDIYRKMKYIMRIVNPEDFECILMVDADTIVESSALSYMVHFFLTDKKIMGMCGETKIMNKFESWVSMIQVFEYYISHHLSKSFESVFGGVTCLPGCFCMYRIKVNEKAGVIPILSNTFIVNAYSTYVAETLHLKNLLYLGEDRYLTTLLLKTFYKRKLVFIPQAKAETLVPGSFGVLLSQRRRWINSTIHNLFELVLVGKLCGTFCCSMQFVVVMELMGTLVLPAAIVFTGVLIASSILIKPEWIPLVMLGGILGLPAILILLTTREISYLFWIVVYIFSLPIWNFVLPVYAFWHFDDFSWGETRKVEGGNKHGETEGVFDSSRIMLKHLEDFEGNE